MGKQVEDVVSKEESCILSIKLRSKRSIECQLLE